MSIELITRWDADWGRRFPVRLTAKQKERFLQELEAELRARHFETERLEFRNIFLNRVLATQCARPEVIFLAHYDTPTIFPVWAPILLKFGGHTRQILTLVVFFLVFLMTTFLDRFTFLAISVLFLLSCVTLCIPNPANREDNTSGVIGLMAIADWMQNRPALKDKVQFVFLDNEEWGLLGSLGLKRLWDSQGHPYANAFVICLDCISRGRWPLVIYHYHAKTARRVIPFLQKYLPETKLLDLKIEPVSDNYVFRQQAAIDITYADPSLIPGGYYVPLIHSPDDKKIYPDRLFLCVAGLIDFLLQVTSAA